tara:strand:+ start:2617 stop:2790 length:174 start_codon:yes stop_codon:yes gene_type:complete
MSKQTHSQDSNFEWDIEELKKAYIDAAEHSNMERRVSTDEVENSNKEADRTTGERSR